MYKISLEINKVSVSLYLFTYQPHVGLVNQQERPALRVAPLAQLSQAA